MRLTATARLLLAAAVLPWPGALAQVPVPSASMLPGRNDRSLDENGIPAVEPQSTAAPRAAIDASGVARDPKAAPTPLAPAYPYPTNPPSTAATGVLPVSTLADAIALAYERNPRLLRQRSNLKATDFRYPQARSRYGPQIEASGSYIFSRDRIEQANGTEPVQQGFVPSASVTLNQPVLTFGRNRAEESRALSEIALGRDNLRIVEAEVLFDVVTAYVSVIRDSTAVTIAEQNLGILERQYADSTERFRVREITSTDLQQVETRLEAARGQLLAARGRLGASQAQFLRDVGAPPGELRQPDVLQVPVTTIEQAYAIADGESPVIRAAQSQEKVSRSAVQAARSEFLPRVDVQASADHGTVSPYSDDRRTNRVRAQAVLTVPIFDSGLRGARLGEAREANQADWRSIEQAQRETRAAVADAWNQLAAARSALSFYAASVEAARRAYEGARIQERAGARTTLDVLDLARDLLSVQTSYNTAIANEYLARAALLSAMGRLEAPKLVGVAAYDPGYHFRYVSGTGDIPLVTPILSTLDGLVIPPVSGDRPNLDPAATVATGGQVALPPDSAGARVSPTGDR